MSTIVKYNCPSLYSLPVEIFYRILDDVDGQTIVLSFRNVCTKFEAIANSYNRYKLDLTSISNNNFDFVCHHIRAESIISLTLSNGEKTPDEIDRFFSLVAIDQLIRLRSLTFLQMNNNELQNRLHSIFTVCPLTCLSIKSRDDDELQAQSLLLSIVTQSNLRRLDFNVSYYREIDKISWPANCTLEYLRMNTCTIQQLCAILDHSPNLRTLVLKHCSEVNIGLPVVKTYSQLTSLTFEKFALYIHHIEVILLHTPSLVYLKVVNNDDACQTLFNGSRWEKLIQMKLPQLKNFEFFFAKIPSHTDGSAEIESLIGPFRTPFWSETKQWTVAFAYLKHIRRVILCSLPVCLTSFSYYCGYQESGDPDQRLYSTKLATIKEVCCQSHGSILFLNTSIFSEQLFTSYDSIVE
jgi:hypothetical protein